MPSLAMIFKLAEVFGVAAAELVREMEDAASVAAQRPSRAVRVTSAVMRAIGR